METVLIIEDDAALSRGLKDNFAFQGYNVLLAADGEKGFSLAIDARPDLIVLDLMLPRMNGYEICRRLRRERTGNPRAHAHGQGARNPTWCSAWNSARTITSKNRSACANCSRARKPCCAAAATANANAGTFGEYVLDVAARTLTHRGQPVEVSPKEFALLLRFFLQRAGQALSREEILNRVWGYDVSVTPSQHRPLRGHAAAQDRARSTSPGVHPDRAGVRLQVPGGRGGGSTDAPNGGIANRRRQKDRPDGQKGRPDGQKGRPDGRHPTGKNPKRSRLVGAKVGSAQRSSAAIPAERSMAGESGRAPPKKTCQPPAANTPSFRPGSLGFRRATRRQPVREPVKPRRLRRAHARFGILERPAARRPSRRGPPARRDTRPARVWGARRYPPCGPQRNEVLRAPAAPVPAAPSPPSSCWPPPAGSRDRSPCSINARTPGSGSMDAFIS